MAKVRSVIVAFMTFSLIGAGATSAGAYPVAGSPSSSSVLPSDSKNSKDVKRQDQPKLSKTIDLDSTESKDNKRLLIAKTDGSLEPVGDSIEIVKLDSGEVVQTCNSGEECSIEVPDDGASYVARSEKLESPVVSTSSSMMSVPSIALTTNRTEIDIDGMATLEAVANGAPSLHRIYIFEIQPDQLKNSCFSVITESSCQVNVSLRNSTTQTYIAYLADSSNGISPSSPDDLQDVFAVSNTVTVDLSAWYVSLHTNTPFFKSGDSFWLTSQSNQAESRSPYRTYIFNVATDTLLSESRYEEGTGHDTFKFDTSQEYRAYVASNANGTPVSIADLEDIRATSNTVKISRLPWTADITSVSKNTNGLNITMTANQKFFNNNYRGALVDANTGRIIRLCSNSTTTCVLEGYPSPLYDDEDFPLPTQIKGVVGRWSNENGLIDTYNPDGYLFDVQAETQIIGADTGTPAQPSTPLLQAPHTNTGGSNPSQNCVQRCHADPINSITGEFWESKTDIAAGGYGPGLAFTRGYAVLRSDDPSSLGEGWTHNYEMKLVPAQQDPTPTSLDQSSGIQVVQENGSLLTFTKTSTGSYLTDFKTMATLEKQTDGTFRFIRGKKQVFTFDAAGKLMSISDLNGNVNTLTYDSQDRVSQIADGRGRSLTLVYGTNGLLQTVTDHTGRDVTYTYDAQNRLVTVTDVKDEDWSYTYNSAGLVETMTRPRGGVTTNTYDSQKRVITQTDPLGKVTQFEYKNGQTVITYPDSTKKSETFDADGRVILETVAVGTADETSTSFEYNDMNLPSTITDGLGRVTSYTYDINGNLLTETDPLGAVTTYTYDGLNNPLTITDALSNVTTMTYDSLGNLTSVQTPEGRKTTWTHNPDGSIATITKPRGNESGATPSAFTTAYGYATNGDLQTITSPKNEITTFTTDALSRVIETQDAKGNVTSYTYDPSGAMLTVEDDLGNTSTFTYDEEGNVLTQTDALLNTTAYTYDLMGRQLTSTNAEGQVQEVQYDSMGRVIKTIDADSNETVTTYDFVGRVKNVTDSENRVTKRVWNKVGELTQFTDPMNRNTTYTYGPTGLLLQVTDPSSRVTKYEYDLLGRTIKMTDPGGRVTTYSYDKDSLNTSLKRNDNSVLSWEYDADGNVVAKVDATQESSTLTYDANGLLTSSVDRLGRATAYEYDAVGNLVKKTAPDLTETVYTYDDLNQVVGIDYAGATPDVSMTYDDLGRLVSETVSSEETTYAYDSIGNLTRRGPPGTTGGVSYTYDDRNNITSITYPSGRVVTYDYNSVNEPTSTQSTGLGTVATAYNKNGLPTTTTLPSGVVETRTYNTSNDPLTLQVAKGTSTLYTKTHSYQSDGLIRSTSYTRPGTYINGEYVEYDALARLSSFAYSDITLDSRGNMVARGNTTSTYDTAGQLLTSTVGSGSNITTYSYDGRGNRTAKTPVYDNPTSYEYDNANRLTYVETSSYDEVSYSYDVQGSRVSRQEGTQTAESLTWDLNRSIPVLLDDSTYEFIYQPGSYVPFAQIEKSTGEVTYLHSDSIGSVMAATDDTGTLIDHYSYDAYGVSSDQRATPFGFAGQYQDELTGLYDFRNRVYDPETGSFLQRDPAELSTDEPYAYTSGNPLQHVDPLGLWDWDGPINITDATGNLTLTAAQKFSRTGGVVDAWTFGNAHRVENAIGISGSLNQCRDQFAFGQGLGGLFSPSIPGVGLAAKGIARYGTKIADWGADLRSYAALDEVGSIGSGVRDFASRRVTLRKSTKDAIHAAAEKTSDGKYYYDPNNRSILIPVEGPYHYGHRPGFEWRRTQALARKEGWTRKELIDFENNPDHYWIEDPSSNMSHKYEAK